MVSFHAQIVTSSYTRLCLKYKIDDSYLDCTNSLSIGNGKIEPLSVSDGVRIVL